MAYFRYWFMYTNPNTKETKPVVFYADTEKGARKNYEDAFGVEPGEVLKRENW